MNLREYVDSRSPTIQVPRSIKVQDQALIRRNTSRTGPSTSEVTVCTVLAMNDETATVSIRKPMGMVERRTVPVSDLSPVTESFKRSSTQFNPAFRGRV